ncbi:hypothetical protein VST7929_02074 [Vibrio stylophorae]|uniref:DUF2956 domain-containing protein n=1 Tax=Vibrio stylophorae TaxID=659351 RepID=A0ABM8ZV18_9VIBR|nr:DUF2956 family protein [Vibrio stylophorae]CAH0534166.1 hypothetical protein VST7929_02074 [Vibrio stylophorae]
MKQPTRAAQDAEAIAKATQKPGQTKAQTKLIAQGIQQGIELYKKQQKQKSRDADKAKKKQLKAKQQQEDTVQPSAEESMPIKAQSKGMGGWICCILTWGLLLTLYFTNLMQFNF